jgi:NAD(P)-dependent dehydrogenase (short-subunit alcohol dehydrogenase family)
MKLKATVSGAGGGLGRSVAGRPAVEASAAEVVGLSAPDDHLVAQRLARAAARRVARAPLTAEQRARIDAYDDPLVSGVN